MGRCGPSVGLARVRGVACGRDQVCPHRPRVTETQGRTLRDPVSARGPRRAVGQTKPQHGPPPGTTRKVPHFPEFPGASAVVLGKSLALAPTGDRNDTASRPRRPTPADAGPGDRTDAREGEAVESPSNRAARGSGGRALRPGGRAPRRDQGQGKDSQPTSSARQITPSQLAPTSQSPTPILTPSSMSWSLGLGPSCGSARQGWRPYTSDERPRHPARPPKWPKHRSAKSRTNLMSSAVRRRSPRANSSNSLSLAVPAPVNLKRS